MGDGQRIVVGSVGHDTETMLRVYFFTSVLPKFSFF